jgi:hypothetical protein
MDLEIHREIVIVILTELLENAAALCGAHFRYQTSS